jgi:hypothetical protein
MIKTQRTRLTVIAVVFGVLVMLLAAAPDVAPSTPQTPSNPEACDTALTNHELTVDRIDIAKAQGDTTEARRLEAIRKAAYAHIQANC